MLVARLIIEEERGRELERGHSAKSAQKLILFFNRIECLAYNQREIENGQKRTSVTSYKMANSNFLVYR